MRYFERQLVIELPIFNNSFRKKTMILLMYRRVFFNLNTILCVLRVFSPIKIEINNIINAFLSILLFQKHMGKTYLGSLHLLKTAY